MSEERYQLFLDYDDTELEFVKTEALELREEALEKLQKILGHGIIMESSKGHYLLLFPLSDLSYDEWSYLMGRSNAHIGHIRYSRLVGEACVRISKKPVSGIEEPKVIAVI